MECVECGSCTYSCPSGIPIVQMIRTAKNNLRGEEGQDDSDAQDPKLLVQPSPLLKQRMSTDQAMRDVLYALLPATLAGIWYFGLAALLVILASIAGALFTEWIFSPAQLRGARLRDSSGLLTGLLLGLSLPPALPLWMAFVGGAVAIGLGKLIWGGLGSNLFNPSPGGAGVSGRVLSHRHDHLEPARGLPGISSTSTPATWRCPSCRPAMTLSAPPRRWD